MSELSKRPRVLVLAYSHLAMDARVLRQVQTLSERYDVTSAAFGTSPIEACSHVELVNLPPYRYGWFGRLAYTVAFVSRLFPVLTRFSPRDRSAAELLNERPWDVIVANDVDTMPLALKLGAKFGIVADLHEYASRQNEHSLWWRLLTAPYAQWLVRRVAAGANVVTTVSQGIADEYGREFGINAEVVTNASDYRELVPTKSASPLRLVHSGAPAVQRRLETMIDAMRMTKSDLTLDFYLLEDGSTYLEELKQRAAGMINIRFNEPVEPGKLVEVLNQYDIGLSVFAPTTFNLAWCLPNKFFDYVQARLGVIIGPSPEMQRSVQEYGIGAVARDFSAEGLAEVFDNLRPDDVRRWKAASHQNARTLSSGPQNVVWQAAIDRLLNN